MPRLKNVTMCAGELFPRDIQQSIHHKQFVDMDTPSEKSTMMFAGLVSMFSAQAMMAMGKIHNPMTGKTERNLQAAQVMIDMLEMFEERTRLSRTDDETKMITAALSDARLNYVYEINSEKQSASQPSDSAAAAEINAEPVSDEVGSADDVPESPVAGDAE